MNRPHVKYQHVYPIARFDLFQYDDSRAATTEELYQFTCVVKVYENEVEAQAEVERLNMLRTAENTLYALYTAHLVPSTANEPIQS